MLTIIVWQRMFSGKGIEKFFFWAPRKDCPGTSIYHGSAMIEAVPFKLFLIKLLQESI